MGGTDDEMRRAEAERQRRISTLMRQKENTRRAGGGAPHSVAPQASATPDVEAKERAAFLSQLLAAKPWLAQAHVAKLRLPVLRVRFSFPEGAQSPQECTPAHLEELQFIRDHVAPKLGDPLETKTSEELLRDVRYFGKHAHFLQQRFATCNCYELLGLHPPTGAGASYTPTDIKKAFRRTALVWHPDSIRKTHRFYFANERALQGVVTEIYKLIDDAYRILSDEKARSQYDAKLRQMRHYS